MSSFQSTSPPLLIQSIRNDIETRDQFLYYLEIIRSPIELIAVIGFPILYLWSRKIGNEINNNTQHRLQRQIGLNSSANSIKLFLQSNLNVLSVCLVVRLIDQVFMKSSQLIFFDGLCKC